ncbi:ROK family glucokinase [Salinicoccus sp. ID82-1]|uniref:Glucokinase n=1 Tax=Salinicoccus cyprini TaxID=2493691 RepID=A0A558AYY3_9STAP|nr:MULTISPECIES: ROK family glucokinase [Salinicoccus]MCG1009011.1 ROK family glucokinase [Salinicoccus sp. ID82-1]TVT29463.1 ROK family glucokinase [Salinicoccus cyprini]
MKRILAADIGGTTCKLGVFTPDLELLDKWEIPTDTTDEGSRILEDIHQSFKSKGDDHELNLAGVIGIGLGVPGPVDFNNGILNGAINLNWMEQKPIVSEFESISGIRTIVDNDANVAALGEQFKGAGSGHKDVVMVTLGTGVGGGVVSNSMLIHGHGGAAGEIGHLYVDYNRRFQCNCGKKGCLETVASATGMKNLAVHYYESGMTDTLLKNGIEAGTLSAKSIVEAGEKDDALALKVIDEVAHYIAVALSSLSAVTNPKYFILGGGVSRAGRMLTDRIEAYYRPITFPPAYENTEIVMAELGNDAGIYGAARLVKQFLA